MEETHYYGDGCNPPHGVTMDSGHPIKPVVADNATFPYTDGQLAEAAKQAGIKRGENITIDTSTPAGVVVDHNGRKYHSGGIVRDSDTVNPHQENILFGGVTAREALGMVTAEELAAELLKRVNPKWDGSVQHSKETPKRFIRSLKELCGNIDPWNFTTFKTDSDEMVTLGPIPFYTLCAHHVVPFHGKVWIGYVPDCLIAGLSKFPRAVKQCAKGFWVQEELTTEIHQFINSRLHPKGLAVVMKAEHMCMAMRGVQTPGVITTTAKMSGVFGDHDRTAKQEFMEWIKEA